VFRALDRHRRRRVNNFVSGEVQMINDRSRLITSRRGLLKGGAALSGAAAAAAGLPAYRALAADSVNDSLLKKVLDRGKVVVGTGATNPPWHFEDDSGKPVGMDIDMAKAVAVGLFGIEQDPKADDDAGVRNLIEFVIQEPNQRIPNLLGDKVDVVIQFMTVTVDRATQVEFTIPYYREATSLLLPADSPYNSIADMQGKGLTIAILQNVGAEESIHLVVPDATVQQFPSTADSIAALDAGRVDATGVDLSSGKWFAANTPGKYKFTDGWNPNSYSMAVKPGDQIWLNIINTVIHESVVGINFARYAAAFKQWFGEDLPSPVAGFPVEYK
jgi:polar amino acid transport system substrate-binding protein